jgi:hypothetical protein
VTSKGTCALVVRAFCSSCPIQGPSHAPLNRSGSLRLQDNDCRVVSKRISGGEASHILQECFKRTSRITKMLLKPSPPILFISGVAGFDYAIGIEDETAARQQLNRAFRKDAFADSEGKRLRYAPSGRSGKYHRNETGHWEIAAQNLVHSPQNF